MHAVAATVMEAVVIACCGGDAVRCRDSFLITVVFLTGKSTKYVKRQVDCSIPGHVLA